MFKCRRRPQQIPKYPVFDVSSDGSRLDELSLELLILLYIMKLLNGVKCGFTLSSSRPLSNAKK